MYNSYGVSPTILDSSPKFVASGIWTIVSVILAIIGGIVLYFTFLSKKNEGKFTGFLGWLYDFLTFKKNDDRKRIKNTVYYSCFICYIVIIWINVNKFFSIFINISYRQCINQSYI